MVQSYQKIVRHSSKRPSHPGTATLSTSLNRNPNSARSPVTPTVDASLKSAKDDNDVAASVTKEKKSRFHGLAKLQMGSLGRSKNGKDAASGTGKDSASVNEAGEKSDKAAESAASSPSRRQQPMPPYGYPGGGRGYPYPPYPPYSYGPSLHPHPPPPTGYPPSLPPGARYTSAGSASTPLSSSTTVLPSPAGPPSGTASAHSPTTPTTPASTGVAHYYPYVASQPQRQNDGYNGPDGGGTMASPQSFRSRGGFSREVGEREELLRTAGSGASGSEAGGKGERREPALLSPGSGSSRPGGGPPALSLQVPNSRSTRAYSNPPASAHPYSPHPYPWPPYPPRPHPHLHAPPHSAAPSSRGGDRDRDPSAPWPSYAPSSSSARTTAPSFASRPPPPHHPHYPYPPPAPPHGYPPYPGYPPYGYPPWPPYPYPPPPHSHPHSHPPPHPAAQSQPSLPRPRPSLPPSNPSYSAATTYGPHPFSGPASQGGSSSPAVNAVERNMARERERDRDKGKEGGGGGGGGTTGKKREDDSKMSVGIDFGTTFTGIAYGSSRLFSGQIRQILSWPGSYETYRKVPTCILYSQEEVDEEEENEEGEVVKVVRMGEAKVVAWGIEAKNATVRKGLIKCEWFKLLLSPESLRSGVPDPWLPPLPVGKNVVDVIADFLRCVWRYARRMITEECGSVVDLNAADVLLTVPAAWDAAACSLMRESALRGGLVQSSRGGDVDWRDRLQIITEPEAGAIHASTLATLHHLRPSQCFLLCDAGGGTVDSGVYKLMGQLSELEIAEMCVRSGANTGSLFVDLKFEEVVRRILKDHPVHLEPASMATFIHAFAEGDKLAYHGTVEDDDAVFRFNCFNVQDSHDPEVGLEFGELAIPGKVLKTEVFDPVIEQVLDLISTQIAKMGTEHLSAIIMVGGFSASEYLYTRVRQVFGATVPVIVRPQDCDTATLRGAARYGLGLRLGKGAVSSVIAPRSYCMKSKLPAEDEDHWRRPEFIATNDGGTVVCENRLSYLIAKGAVLRKGERLRSRFCKYIKDPHDSVFTAHLFVSDSEELYRYTDEGDLHELCRWTLDLAALPRFESVARNGGGYIEFEAGLSLDSAEVRGVLMTEDGIECAAATFEFLGT
ncbi:hypothetical protein JCM11641_007059 [Rhodosporidiobolus odoratus]